jgi:hypothetical protein
VTGFSGNGNEPWGFIRVEAYLEHLRDCQPLK